MKRRIRALTHDLKKRFSPNRPDYRGVFAASRWDRYGANAVPWIAAIAYSRLTHAPLYHGCSEHCGRFVGSVAHDLLLQRAIRVDERTFRGADSVLFTDATHDWVSGLISQLMDESHGIPLPDVLRETGLADELFDGFRGAAAKNGWELPWGPDRSVTIHVRLGDMKSESNGSNQRFIGEHGLGELVKTARRRFPTHSIHLVTNPAGEDQSLCREVAARSGVPCNVTGHEDADRDLWLMMRSDILIMSRSTFSIVSGLLHQGSQVFTYERWTHFDDVVGARHRSYRGTNRSKLFKVL